MKRIHAAGFLIKKRKIIVEVISALFILLFVYTALSKLTEPGKFKWALGESILLKDYAGFIAWALPATEIIVALLLFLPKTRRHGLYSSFGLMAFFTIYLGYMLTFDSKLPCSCGGVLQEMTWTQHLVFNILFTLLAGIGILLMKKTSNSIGETPSVVFT